MKITAAPSNYPVERLRVMQTLTIGDTDYNYGTVVSICGRLHNSSPDVSTRIQNDPAMREMLLANKVVLPTEAYPVAHPWCRFYRGEGFQVFFDALMKASDELEQREPLHNDEPNPFLQFLSGESWAISPAPDALGKREDRFFDHQIDADEEDGTVWINIDTGEEFPYSIEMTPEVADVVVKGLHELIKMIGDTPSDGNRTSFEVRTEREEIRFTVDLERRMIVLTGEGWEEEGERVEMTVAQADDAAWELHAASNTLAHKNVHD